MTDGFERMMAEMRDPSTVRGRGFLRYSRAMNARRSLMHHTFERIPLVGGVMSTFWTGVIGEYDVSISGGLNALSYEYLGDFLFWHQPMTVRYDESIWSRLPWPRRLHLHIAPCYPFWKDAKSGKRHRAPMVCSRRRPRDARLLQEAVTELAKYEEVINGHEHRDRVKTLLKRLGRRA